MTALVFMDTETTGLALDDDIWEFAGIRREEDGTQTELHLFIEHDENKCEALPESFSKDHIARYDADQAVSPWEAAALIGKFMGGKAHIVGAVPNFDTERISMLLNHHGSRANWHYHLIDVENLAVGYLNGRRSMSKEGIPPLAPPWDSDELSRLCGIDPPTVARHTAMGDALWAMRLYDQIRGHGERSQS